MICGIDNGVTGGIVLLRESGQIAAQTRMPVRKIDGTNEVDTRAVFQWLSEQTGNLSNADYYLEKPVGSKSYKAAVSMAASFHCLRGLFDAKMLNWHRVSAREWQSVMIPAARAGENKREALRVATELWPTHSFIATKRSRVAHSGIVDAALIARWALDCSA